MIRSTLLCLGGSLLVATGISAQQPGPQGDTTRAMRREMMMQRVQAADARLDKLVGEMNRATGAKKVEAMAAVINEMVAQRKQMRAHMRQMMEMMDSGGMMGGPQGPRPGARMDPRRQAPADTSRAQPSVPDDGDHTQHHDSAGGRPQ